MGKGAGRGGAQLGKAVKGKSKDRKKDKNKIRNQVTEQRLDEEIKILQEYEKLNKLWEAQRNRLKKLQQQEAANAKLNKQLIINIHRQFLRDEKVDSLRKEIQIAAQNHERDVDRRDAQIQALTRDLDESEEQYQTAQRAHLDKAQTLINLQHSKIKRLESEFERDLKALKSEFLDERKQIEKQHADEVKEMEAVNKAIALEDARQTEDAKARHSAQVQTIRNKHDGLLSELKRTLENKIADLEKNFDQLHKSYKDTTDGANQNFKKLELEDARRAEFIKLQEQLIHKYQENLAHWSKVIASNFNECTARNGALRAQRDAIAKHCNELKERMKKFRVTKTKRLTELTVLSRAALQANEEKLTRAQKILQLAELARKMETEREKVVPFYQSTPIPPQLLPAAAAAAAPAAAGGAAAAAAAGPATQRSEEDTKQADGEGAATGRDSLADVNEVFGIGAAPGVGPNGEAAVQRASALQLDGSNVGHWSYLENFHKKYNKVLLDKLAIAQEKRRLEKENGDLRGILKQYLDGISITQDVVDQDNPLLIVNGKVNLVERMPVRRGGPRTTQEAVQIVQHYKTHARPSRN